MRNYRKTLAGIAAIAMLLNTAPAAIPQLHSMLSVTVSAAEEAVPAYLTYESKGTSITITACAEDATGVIIPETIEGLPVTAIADGVFTNCRSMETLTLPATITSFCVDDLHMLSSMGTLKDVIWQGTLPQWEDATYTVVDGGPDLSARLHIPADGLVMGVYNTYYRYTTYTEENYAVINGVANVEYDLPITEVVIPAEIDGVPVRTIGSSAFKWQSGITSVTLPDSITTIQQQAFSNCQRLETINIPSKVRSIGDSAFANCYALNNVTLPSWMTALGNSAFFNCTAFTEITIPTGINVLGQSVLGGCTSLTTVHLPSSLDEIRSHAFSSCTALTDIYYDSTEENWNTITIDPTYNEALDTAAIHYKETTEGVHGDLTYQNVGGDYIVITGLANDVESVTIPAEIDGVPVTHIGDSAFAGKENVTSVALPDSITSIGDYAFRDCHSLVVCHLPGYLNDLGKYAFQNCYMLRELSTPADLYAIPEGCFSGCIGLTTVVINGSLAVIEPDAFNGCNGMEAVHMPDSITSIGQNAFQGCSALEDVYYEGEEEDWNALVPAIEAGNEMLTAESTTRHFAGIAKETESGLTYYKYWDHIEIINADPYIKTADIPAQIDGLPVTMISTFAFEDCTLLESVTIPDTVTTIGSCAFMGCTSLKSITIPNTVTTLRDGVFSSCTSLTDAVVEMEASYLPTGTFSGCKSLVNVTLPDTITDIRMYVFSGCTSLTEIDLPDHLTSIDDDAFRNCTSLKAIYLPDTLTDIGTNTFSGCTAMTEISIPASVIRIGRAAFSGSGIAAINVDAENEKYQSVDGVLLNKAGTYLHCYPSGMKGTYTVPEGVLVIDTEAFLDSAGLTSVTIADSVVTIMDRAFQGCTGLTKFNIPATLESIRSSVFAGCTGLTEFIVEEGNTEYAVVDGMLTEPGMARLLCCPASKTGSVTIPEEITQLATGAFSGCTELTEIVLHDGITSISRSAFENCTGLTTIELPAALKSIQEMAFTGCTSLESIRIPNNVTEIPYSAFEDCTALTEIYLPAGITDVRLCAFHNCPSLTTVNYGSTEEQWNAIIIEDYNDALLNAAVNFSEGLTLGDLDGDGTINTTDAAILLMDAATEGATGNSNLTDAQKAAADVNGDGERNASDASLILHYAAYVGTGGTEPIDVFIANRSTAAQ